MTPPLFIVLDGIDGCGKTTQGKRLKSHFIAAGHAAAYFEDPGSTPAATRIREILLDKDCPLSPKEQLLLYTAARSSLSSAIRDSLDRGEHVICSRWLSSTVAYQGYMEGLGPDTCVLLHRELQIRNPDLYLLMTVDPATGHARKHGADERFESRSLAWKTGLNALYGSNRLAHYLATSHTGVRRIPTAVVDANGTEDEVFQRVLAAVGPYLPTGV